MRSRWQTPQARTRRRTVLGSRRGISRSSSRKGAFFASRTRARIGFPRIALVKWALCGRRAYVGPGASETQNAERAARPRKYGRRALFIAGVVERVAIALLPLLLALGLGRRLLGVGLDLADPRRLALEALPLVRARRRLRLSLNAYLRLI